MRAAVVLDNLIHRGEMAVTIGVFVDPGEPGNRNLECARSKEDGVRSCIPANLHACGGLRDCKT
jgi:hypothetical protein